ncbi:serine hydrolase domain-containing protein [Desulforhopalus singaporensis]|uniref:Beta-lactamase-related domain-containing protein n=1 Tax=Desulforhopalus singaporensis TaxID=91360 RepID=A0A1H0SDX8_9BACT|nr:serine hydrolase [Desulforhopalus singaporensis]SDP39428.1 hypothetical protein SAMN05660330_02625 [Desulforhopalus singaporensis]
MSNNKTSEQWMRGFPPPEDRIISVDKNNHYNWPELCWTFSNTQQLVPTKSIWRGPGAASKLEVQDAGIDKLTITDQEGKSLGWQEALKTIDTDGFAVLKRGVLVYENYQGYCGPHKTHLVMSCAKSFVGTLAELMIDEGTLDENALVPHYMPELTDTAWHDATVRQVMDMLIGMQFHEDYLDPGSDVWKYLRAGGMVAGRPEAGHPTHLAEYLMTVKKQGEHGKAFAYREPNINVLSFIIQRIANKDLQELVSERFWQHMGAEHDGWYMVDPAGMSTTAGCTLRDFLRFGELIRTGGKKRQAVSPAVTARLVKGGSRELFARAQYPKPYLQGWSYKSQWWIRHKEDGNAITARGAHGQLLYIDPGHELVIARFGSSGLPPGYLNDPVLLPMIDAVAAHLETY